MWLKDQAVEEKKRNQVEEESIQAWADGVIGSILREPLKISSEAIPVSLSTRESLKTSYGRGNTPPLPHIVIEDDVVIMQPSPFMVNNKRDRNVSRADLYKMYADEFPESITIEQARDLQDQHSELSGIQANSVVAGVSRAITRVKKKWMRFE